MSDICNTFCSTTKKQRDTILLLEALALIHDIGKLSDRFLESLSLNSNTTFNYSLFIDPRETGLYKSFFENQTRTSQVKRQLENAIRTDCAFSARPDLTENLKAIEITDWNNTTYTLADLVPFLKLLGRKDLPELFGNAMHPGLLIKHMHGIAHFDKDGGDTKQLYEEMYRGTPFGFEEKIQTGTVKELNEILSRLPLRADDIQKITSDDRQKWLDEMRKGMSKGVADTRKSLNDITLWDWGYIVSSLTKASANYIFKTGWLESPDDIEFVILRVNLDILELYASSDKISDMLGKQKALEENFTSVKTLLEKTSALGNRIYHDETGDYYLMPNVFSDEDEKALRQAILELFPIDMRPRVHFGKPLTAGSLDLQKNKGDKTSVKQAIRQLIADPRQEAKTEHPVQAGNNHHLFENEWGKDRHDNSEICSVCGKHPVGYPAEASSPDEEEKLARWATREKAEERNICRHCLERRGRRASEWGKTIQNTAPETTIWTDEVADENGRLALFIGTFGLDPWLNGSILDTISKKPSPARMYRIAETARAFWKQIKEKELKDIVGQRLLRLKLEPDSANVINEILGDFHTCELEYQGSRTAVVWDKKNKYFLTIENLDSFAKSSGKKQSDLLEYFGKVQCIIRLPSSYGKVAQKADTVSFRNVTQTMSYYPTIPLLLEPSLFMTLVPANKAIQFVKSVKVAYELQMKSVQDSLPLGIGLVFFPKNTPVRAVMEAGNSIRNMLASKPAERSPSRFDFEFLDTAGRRYEICYDEKGKRGASRPFYLADFDRLEHLWKLFEHLSLSQRYQIIGLIETKREEWKISSSTSGEEQQIFSQFIADTLAGANWPKEKKWYTIGKNDRDNLVEAATNGQLKDWAELHMQILKEKNGGRE